MDIEDFEIKIKKFDREKNYVIVNIVICKEFEIRGYIARYTKTRYSVYPIWIVSPPVVYPKGKNKKPFWVTELKNPDLWEKLQQEIIRLVKEHTRL